MAYNLLQGRKWKKLQKIQREVGPAVVGEGGASISTWAELRRLPWPPRTWVDSAAEWPSRELGR